MIDDESDYFASDSKWIDERQRKALKQREEELREKKYASRTNRTVTLDFAGRQVQNSQIFLFIPLLKMHYFVFFVLFYAGGRWDRQHQHLRRE